jgi:hemerythrin superfamily protein
MATKKPARKSTARKPDALRMLKDDHDKLKGMFEKFKSSRSDDKKAELVEMICRELTIHTQLEEEIFYPAVREAIDDTDLLDEALVEHASAKELIEDLEQMAPGDDLFDAKVTVLGEYVTHHIREEQNEMFPLVRKSGLDLMALAEQLRDRKQELEGDLEEMKEAV